MRFWGKGKHGDKKMSIRGHSADADLTKTRNGKNAESGCQFSLLLEYDLELFSKFTKFFSQTVDLRRKVHLMHGIQACQGIVAD